jgi:hypothetical protein
MRLKQKTCLFPVQIGMPLANASKICMYMDTVRFPTIGYAVNVQWLDIGKPDIYHGKDELSWQPILVIIGHPEKNCCRLT